MNAKTARSLRQLAAKMVEKLPFNGPDAAETYYAKLKTLWHKTPSNERQARFAAMYSALNRNENAK
jgi:hypothetical protein